MNWNSMNSQQRLQAVKQIADFNTEWAKTNADVLQEGANDSYERIQQETLRLVLASQPEGIDLEGGDMQTQVKLVSDALAVATFQERERLQQTRPQRQEVQQGQYLDHEVKQRTVDRMRSTSPEMAEVGKRLEQNPNSVESQELQPALIATSHTGDEHLDSYIAERQSDQRQKVISDEQFNRNLRESAARKAQQELAAHQAQDNPVVAGNVAGKLQASQREEFLNPL